VKYALMKLLSIGNLFFKTGEKMKHLIKITAGFVLSATMATASLVLQLMLVSYKGLQGHSNQ